VSTEEGHSQTKWLVAKGKKNEKSSSERKSRSKNYKCHYCHKHGHFRRDFPKLKNKKGKEVANVVEDSSNGSKNFFVISHCSVYCSVYTDEK